MKSRLLFLTVVMSALAVLAAPVEMIGQATPPAGAPVYVVSAGLTGNGIFGTVNPTTGAFLPMGPGEPEGYFGLAPGPQGTLFSLTYTGNLVSINRGTGVPTEIGPTGLGNCADPTACGPNPAFSLGGFNGKIFATDFANDIYTVDPKTGAATPLSFNSGIPASPFILGSQDSGTQFPGTQVCQTDFCLNFADEAIWQSGGGLYLTYDAWVFDAITASVVEVVIAPALYQIDPTTGLATEVGPTAFGIGGATEVHGTDYAFVDPTGQIVKLDVTTGDTTPVSNFSGAAGVIQGAVPVSGPWLEGPAGPLHWRWGVSRRP